MLHIATILHPTDFSPRSEHAFHLACSIGRDHGSKLIVLHVAEPPVVGYGTASTPPPEGDWQALENRLRSIHSPYPEMPVAHHLTEGDPATEILRVAGEIKCELIVMGSHGRTGLPRMLMGSVAETVVRMARCAVLVVKRPFGDDATP